MIKTKIKIFSIFMILTTAFTISNIANANETTLTDRIKICNSYDSSKTIKSCLYEIELIIRYCMTERTGSSYTDQRCVDQRIRELQN